jgi:mediator of RNA polymerase II transcription subunit 5
MDTPRDRVHAAREQWRKFITLSFNKRVDPDQFEAFAILHQAKWDLSPMLVADMLLRPSPKNSYVPDMLVPQYIQRLLKRKMVTASTVLHALYRHSTSHTQMEQSNAGLGEAEKGEETKNAKPLRWTNSYSVEEIIFYGLTKAIRQEGVIRSTKDALDLVRVISKWTALLSDVAASLAPSDVMGVPMQSSNLKLEIDATTSAFVLLLLGVCEDPFILGALSRPAAKEARRKLSEALAKFVPYMPHQASDIANRLEVFRTQTLVGFEPVDREKQKEAEDANTQVYEVFDQTVGLDSFQVSELPVQNTRAGLYIYLNAALVGRPLIDDAALFGYLHNRYQVCLAPFPLTWARTDWNRATCKQLPYTLSWHHLTSSPTPSLGTRGTSLATC